MGTVASLWRCSPQGFPRTCGWGKKTIMVQAVMLVGAVGESILLMVWHHLGPLCRAGSDFGIWRK